MYMLYEKYVKIGHTYGTWTFSSKHQTREMNPKVDPGKCVLI